MSHLLPCEGCGRHVRAHESACPFCGASITHVCSGACGPVAASRHASRAHIMGYAVGVAAVAGTLAATACAMYGGPPERDAGTDAAPGGGGDAYGAPPFDASGG